MTAPLWQKVKMNLRASWWSERREWESWLKTQHSKKTKIMASGPITLWQIDGERMETVTDFIFLDSKINAYGDCSHEIKRLLLLRRKFRQHIKKQRHYFADKGPSSQSFVFFPVVMYGCESWTIKKAECWRIDAFELWYWRRLLSPLYCKIKQSFVKEISPEYSLEKLMLMLKLQYFGHLMRWTDSFGKTPDAGKDWRREEKGTTEDEMFGWHHRLNGHEFEQTPGDS